jgi:hypothetical protein
MSRLGSRQQKTHEVLSPRNVCLPVDQEVARADIYRRRAIELAQQAKHEDDYGRRRFLVDKSRALVNVADEIDPPLDEPRLTIF